MVTLLACALFATDVRNLDDESFDVRQKAEARLTAHAWLAWRACDRPMRSPEQRRRAARVCGPYLDFGRPPVILAPLVWGWWYDPAGEDWVILSLIPPGQPAVSDALNYHRAEPLREATRAAAQALVRAGTPPVVVRLWLAYFHHLECRCP